MDQMMGCRGSNPARHVGKSGENQARIRRENEDTNEKTGRELQIFQHMTMPSRYLPGRYLGQAKVFARGHVRNGADAESNLGGWEKSSSNLVRSSALRVA
jgi:hypothetical protein